MLNNAQMIHLLKLTGVGASVGLAVGIALGLVASVTGSF